VTKLPIYKPTPKPAVVKYVEPVIPIKSMWKRMKNEDLVFTKGTKNGPWQWIGYKTNPPKSYYIKMSMKIKFIGKVPKPANGNYGIKIHGNTMNDWTKGLKPN
jgi:hypothetical protein